MPHFIARGSTLRACFLLLIFSLSARSQSTAATGSIQGIVSDQTNSAVSGAVITITGKDTGQVIRMKTSSGLYNAGALIPGQYRVRTEAVGFGTTESEATVQVGTTTTLNIQLQVGSSPQVIEVRASATAVDLAQATVQGVLTAQQIDQLPINGRNFLELAQLEPGVQIQDGTNFDPTKIGYSSIAFGGRFGRAARISVDGVDVSDETVGTTTQSIPLSGIQEFQLSRSTLDLSTDLTSSGAVNVVTRSGSNSYHGELFYLIRDRKFGADLPHPVGLEAPYQRNQFGGRLGGPVVTKKLFFFADYERTKQDSFIPVQYPEPFQNFSGGFNSPFRENVPLGRLDWQATKNLRLFYRFTYFSNLAEASFFAASLQVYRSKNYARTHVAGADFTGGAFTHSIRFSNMKFQNDISDGVAGSGLPLANLGVGLSVMNGPQTGPNLLAPQVTLQLNRQIKYDGGINSGRHFLRCGVNYNSIQALGFWAFFGLAPVVQTNLGSEDATLAAKGPFPGGAGNPLNYPVEIVTLGNGHGFATERPGLGYPAGVMGPDHRLAFYFGDSWRIRSNLTLNLGIRYVRDTGRTGSDLPPFPQLDALIPGTGGRIRQPNLNVAPQIGIVWDPSGGGKTAIRAGAGLFYENALFNILFGSRPPRLATGAFVQTPQGCNFGQSLPVSITGGAISMPAALCNSSVGEAAAGIAAFQAVFQSLARSDLNASNPNYLPTLLENGVNLPGGLLAPGYRTPRALQVNVGVQREIRKGMVLTLDYLRNVSTHTLLGLDANHVGDSRYFDKNAAQQAIAATLAQCGVGSIAQGIAASCPSGNILNESGSPRVLNMTDFARNGLTSPALDFGGICPTDYGCAYPGINPDAPAMTFGYPIGRSVFNGVDVKLRQELRSPLPGLRQINLQMAYSRSRFVIPGSANPNYLQGNDPDLLFNGVDYRSPLAFTGPSLLDRKHQFSFGGMLNLPCSFRAAAISHFYSGLPVTLQVPNTGTGAGEIFRTDFSGDGTVADILPGTKMGSLNRSIAITDLSSVIQEYNSTVANQPTLAGQVLIDNGLFTLPQLQALAAVAPVIPLPPDGQVGVSGLRAFDLKLSWARRFRDRLEIQPNVAIYNLFNFANFDLPPNIISGLLTGSAGSVNGTTAANRITNRVGLGTGTFALGAPRAIEFGLRIGF